MSDAKILFVIAGAVVSAVIVDLDAYGRARENGKPFDWVLAGSRWLKGALVGAMTAYGLPHVS